MIIKTQKELDDICATFSKKPYITIDTEFLRDKTFYSRLCLIQIAAEDVDAVAIDPIEFDLDWAPLNDLLHNENVLKVFHAARQDLEIFYQMNGKIPHPIFDTQVAAMVCGYGDSIAYNKLVQDITGHALAKNAQFTDWSRRPLSGKQLTYALDDVIYLRDVYKTLAKRLKEQKREKWLTEEMEILTSPETYDMPVEDMWKRIKIRSDKPEVLAILRDLASWREELARKKDIPRGRILKDEALADIAVYMPKDVEGLSRIRNVPRDVAQSNTGKILLDIIAKARKSDKKNWPKVERGAPFPKEAVPVLEMLKLLLKINCSESDVAAKLVANVSDLEELAMQKNPKNKLMKGWRYELFGADAMALKNGEITIGLKDGKIHKFKN
ncbi:MAG TPA: ribonuclease D [Alphaproteobacteria bacterium]|nr:ribonuclease D [Alphaproteobacteria bacterium]